MFNQLKPKPEHIEKLLETLAGGELLTPQEIAKRSGLSLTATHGAIEELEKDERVKVTRQNSTPKMQVQLAKV